MELDNLDDIFDLANEVWKHVHWGLGYSYPLPDLFEKEEGEWMKEYSEILRSYLLKKETELKEVYQNLSEKEKSLFRELARLRHKTAD